MKLSNQTKIYVFTGLLFVSVFLTTTYIIKGFKNDNFDYIGLFVSLLLSLGFIKEIIKLSKIENNK
jgi:hypothetical protein